jgi:hypothetical protein
MDDAHGLQSEVPSRLGLPDAQFVGAQLGRTDLSEQEITGCSLLGADLSYANLRNARLTRVDLRFADLCGACLQGAIFDMVEASSAVLRDVDARAVRMHHVNLLEADLRGADLGKSMIRNCTLEHAVLSAANLSGMYLLHSNCSHATLRSVMLAGATTLGSRFSGAEFRGAHQFFACREIVAEILLREAEGDLLRIMECAAIVTERTRCYSHWKDYVSTHPDAQAFAFKVFDMYPDSGCREALRDGYRAAPVPVTGKVHSPLQRRSDISGDLGVRPAP